MVSATGRAPSGVGKASRLGLRVGPEVLRGRDVEAEVGEHREAGEARSPRHGVLRIGRFAHAVGDELGAAEHPLPRFVQRRRRRSGPGPANHATAVSESRTVTESIPASVTALRMNGATAHDPPRRTR